MGLSASRNREKSFLFSHLLLSLALFAAVYPIHADRYGMEKEYFDFDESQVEKWKESAVNLPSYPKDADLLPIPPETADTAKAFIDRRSISRGTDRVARFTLVIESPSRARSVFYEGLRCETREYKTYAIGTLEGSLQPSKEAVWRKIPKPSSNAFRHQLFHRYICDENSSARTPEDVVRLLTQ